MLGQNSTIYGATFGALGQRMNASNVKASMNATQWGKCLVMNSSQDTFQMQSNGPNVELSGPEAALSPEGPARTQGQE